MARVDQAVCRGCFLCEQVCPFGAVERHEILNRQGELVKVVADVNAGVCQGCGTCLATCLSRNLRLDGFTDEQIFAQINAVMG